jgi:HSP20 family protein
MASRFLVPFGGRSSMMRGDPLLQLHREMNRLFDDTLRGFGGGEGGQGGGTLMPSLDVHDIDDGIEVTAELPGVAKDDIDLSLDGDMLTISGEKKNERRDERAHVVERSYGSFRRSVQLPFAPDPGKVQADCENGVLRIRLPRGAEQERSKKIPIGGTMGQQAQGGTENRSAVGQIWSGGEKKDDLAGKPAEQDQNAPA